LSITETVQKDVVAAMKAGDKERLSALRMILSQLQMGAKEAGDGFGEEQERAVLKTEKKRRLQSAEAFRDGGADDRAAKEEAEAALIDTYLPQDMSEAELAALIDEAIAATGAAGPQEMGKVMSQVMPRTAGRADGKVVSNMVRSRLAAGS
jgi:hypothetical protein